MNTNTKAPLTKQSLVYCCLRRFMFGWLILGESSTPLLNLRWFLIRQGLGDTQLMSITSALFAVVFFVTRFVIYGSGLIHLFATLSALTPDVSRVNVAFVTGFVIAGFVLNLVWLGKIAKMAFPKRKTDKIDDTDISVGLGAAAEAGAIVEAEKAKDL
jgi:hypothetical protein